MAIDKAQLDEWMRLAEAATPGPWMAFVIPGSPSVGPGIGTLSPAVHIAVTRDKGYGLIPVDAAFIAAARAAVPALLDALAEAEDARAKAIDSRNMAIVEMYDWARKTGARGMRRSPPSPQSTKP